MARSAPLIASALVLLAAAPAASGAPAQVERTLRAEAGGCAELAYRAPVAGVVQAELRGGPRGDWDLELLDARGSQLGASRGFRSDEIVRMRMRGGQRASFRACRLSGPQSVPIVVRAARAPAARRQASRQSLVLVRAGSRAEVQRLSSLGLDLGEHGWRDGVQVIARGPDDFDLLRRAGLPFRTVIPDLAARDRADRAADARVRGRSALPSGRTEYRQLEDHQADLKALAAAHPALARPLTLSLKTFQGREIQGIEVGAGQLDDGRPTFLLVGIHHAREWPAGEMVTEFVTMLLKRAGEPRIRKLLRTTRIVAVPIQNPDGFVASRSGLELGDPDDGTSSLVPSATATLAYHRKTCSGVFGPLAPCDLNHGTDPNRNYGAHWGSRGASSLQYDQDYRGTAPWAETETEAIHRLAQKLNVTTAMSMHTVAALVLRPPGVVSDGPPPEEALYKPLGDKLGRTTGYGSTSFGEGLGYDGSGITEDWVYGAQGAFTFTIEVGPSGGSFHGAYETNVVEQFTGGGKPGKGIGEALTQLAEAAGDRKLHSRLTGRAPAGAVLKLSKKFQTATGEVCTFAGNSILAPSVPCVAPGAPIVLDDFVEYTLTVPRSGKVSWAVPPSTRPFEAKAGKTESYVLTCERSGRPAGAPRDITVARGAELKLGKLGC